MQKEISYMFRILIVLAKKEAQIYIKKRAHKPIVKQKSFGLRARFERNSKSILGDIPAIVPTLHMSRVYVATQYEVLVSFQFNAFITK
jgi:hypothetical protein